MTLLSVNLNKIALLRNSRGRDYPNVLDFAARFRDLGVRGITVHPRQDERHITRQDAFDLGEFIHRHEDMEFNIEGYPSDDFLNLVEKVRPDQCTLVPDSPDQLTSDHGWNLVEHGEFVANTCAMLAGYGVRSAIFLDPVASHVEAAAKTGTDRIELYTESFAKAFNSAHSDEVFGAYRDATALACELGLGVNAGHDLDLTNLPRFLEIEGIKEVSIGHALTVECIEHGMSKVVADYLAICAAAA